jgi:hypothetical protein
MNLRRRGNTPQRDANCDGKRRRATCSSAAKCRNATTLHGSRYATSAAVAAPARSANVSDFIPPPAVIEAATTASELSALGLSRSDIEQLDRLTSARKDCNPTTYPVLVHQLEVLTQTPEEQTIAAPVAGTKKKRQKPNLLLDLQIVRTCLRRFSKMFWLIFGTRPFASFLAPDPDFADNIFRWTRLLNP